MLAWMSDQDCALDPIAEHSAYRTPVSHCGGVAVVIAPSLRP
jgi:hypothetical protein